MTNRPAGVPIIRLVIFVETTAEVETRKTSCASLLCCVAIESFPDDCFQRVHLSIRQLGELVLAALAPQLAVGLPYKQNEILPELLGHFHVPMIRRSATG